MDEERRSPVGGTGRAVRTGLSLVRRAFDRAHLGRGVEKVGDGNKEDINTSARKLGQEKHKIVK